MAEKKLESKSPQPAEESKPRFRLRFAQGLELGRSQLSAPRLPRFYEPTVTSKFYSTKDDSELQEDEDIRLIIDEISKMKSFGPREKFEEPILESQRYGWFQEKFIDKIADTERIHFPKKTSEMVKIQNLLDNAAKAEQLYQKAKAKKVNSPLNSGW